MRKTLTLLFLCAAPALAQAACPDAREIERFVADWKAKTATKALPVETEADAACAREKVIAALEKTEGRIVGYKAALTGKPAQERFKSKGPVSGALFASMIAPSGTKMSLPIGGNVVYEADMLLVIKDEGINGAKTPEEAMKHISGMRPFIEMPDLMLAKGEKLEAPQLVAMNAAGRLGVAGAEVALPPTAEAIKALTDVKIVMTDASGKTVAENVGSANLGSPLNVVLWLVQDLAASGRKLKAGDLVSIGSFSPLIPPKSGDAVTVRYEGLPGTPTVSTSFE